MRAVILTGGSGTRLKPLTENTRKAYLPLGGKRVVDHIIDRLPQGMQYSISENDSGAVAAISESLTGYEPVMVVCGDNYFSESLDGFAKAYSDNVLVGIYDVKEKTKAKNFGVIKLHPDGKLKEISEKPSRPKGTLVSTGIYLFHPNVFATVKSFARFSPKANIGNLIASVMLFGPVYTYLFKGKWIDIGTFGSYQEALRACL